MTSRPHDDSRGPFRVEHLREGDRYELSKGHPIYCAPAKRDHAGPNVSGAEVLDTDPDVEWAGFDAGFTPEPQTLRAPDVVVAPAGNERDWLRTAPPLAVEYAGSGQDEADLKLKIGELLEAGTQQVWVVRLLGPRRVEVHQAGQPVRTVSPGEALTAPGILRNPVPVEALYDRAAGHRAVLRNLLQREGYESIEAIRAEGIEQGIARSILALLEDRGLTIDAAVRGRILQCRDPAELQRWLLRAARVDEAGALFE